VKIFFRTRRARLAALVVSGIVLAVLYFGFGLVGKGRATASTSPDSREFDMGLEDSRKVAGFVESFGPRIDQAEKRLTDKDAEVERLRAKLLKYDSVLAAIVDELTKRASGGAPSGTPGSADGGPTAGADPLPARLQKFTLSVGNPKPERAPSVRIPAGSFAEGTLLTGVYAPTEGGVLPVQIRLDLAIVGPNRSRIPIQGAFLIGKATGDPNSQRVVIQLDKLSYVKADGRSVEVNVNGYVADDDGVQGLTGRYVWRLQEAASVAAIAGGISAAADAAAQRETTLQVNPLGGVTESVTGDVGKFAAARGASRAAGEIEKIVAKRLENIVPAIYVANGKKLTICLIDGVTLEGLLTSEVKNASSASPYAGLDLDR